MKSKNIKITGYEYNNLPRNIMSHRAKPRLSTFYKDGKSVQKWSRGMINAEDALGYLIKPILPDKKDFLAIGNLVKNWEQIIGKKYSEFCCPKSISFQKEAKSQGKIMISVFNPAIGFFLENNSELIIERLAVFYGYKAISKIIIKQEPKDIGFAKGKEIKLSPIKEKFINEKIAEIEDEELRAVLMEIGKLSIGKN